MRFSGSALLLFMAMAMRGSEAFQVPQAMTVRLPETSLYSASSVIKYILVPNAKTAAVAATVSTVESSSGSSSSSSSPAVTATDTVQQVLSTSAATATATADVSNTVSAVPPPLPITPDPVQVAKVIADSVDTVASPVLAASATESSSSFTSLLDHVHPTIPAGEPGSAPVLYEYFAKILNGEIKGDYNMPNMDLQIPDFPQEKFSAAWAALSTVAASDAWTAQDIIQALNIKELGGWYATFLTLAALLFSQVDTSTVYSLPTIGPPTTTPDNKTNEEEKSSTPTKKPTKPTTTTTMQSEETLLAEVIEELKKLKAERAAMDQGFAELKKEIKSMKATMKKDKKVEKTLRSDLKASEKTRKQQAKQLKGLEDVKETLEKEVNTLKTEVSVLKGEPAPPAASPTKTKSPKPEPAAAQDDIQVTISGTKTPHNVSDAFFAAPEDGLQGNTKAPPSVAVDPAPKTKKKTSKRATSKKKTTTRTSPAATTTTTASKKSGDDWSKLALSTLKRKTVKDLTQYLQQKGATTTGADGKTLKKAELVDAVLSVKA